MSKHLLTIFGLLALAPLAACTKADTPPSRIGLANPASVYCTEQGGKLEIRGESNGQVGYCRLPNGTLVEEWAHYRAAHPALPRLYPAVGHWKPCILNRTGQSGDTGCQHRRIRRSRHKIRARPTFAEKGIAANRHPIMRPLRRAQHIRYLAFGGPSANAMRYQRGAPL
jgi:putative hemolysin